MTIIVGFIVILIGKSMMKFIDSFTLPVSSGILIFFGLIYIIIGLMHKEHSHHHDVKPSIMNKSSAISLFIMLTFSPCEAIIPVFFAASPLGWNILIQLSVVTAICTIGIMLLLTTLAIYGYSKIETPWIQNNERTLIGGILFSLGIFILIFHYI